MKTLYVRIEEAEKFIFTTHKKNDAPRFKIYQDSHYYPCYKVVHYADGITPNIDMAYADRDDEGLLVIPEKYRDLAKLSIDLVLSIGRSKVIGFYVNLPEQETI